jgi:acyl-CoA hydrolase
VGELVHLKASINYTGRSSMVVGLRVEAENIKTGTIKHCNSSYFTMVAKTEDGKTTPVPGILLESEESIRRFARSIERQKQIKTRSRAFEAENFQLDKHIHKLKGHNAQISMGQ